ncbi:MAG: TMEM165/GDT1 family protein [Thermodesulfobacteriota bacterium]|nr:TMEM165/GDT1 family protein [Thermodesulfobacteriota bacterium]
MDFKLFITTFGLVFLAELGDKTQLATLSLSANYNSKISVFLGSAFALIVSSLLAVLFGAGLSRLLPPDYIQIGAGIFFIVIGIWMLISITRIA